MSSVSLPGWWANKLHLPLLECCFSSGSVIPAIGYISKIIIICHRWNREYFYDNLTLLLLSPTTPQHGRCLSYTPVKYKKYPRLSGNQPAALDGLGNRVLCGGNFSHGTSFLFQVPPPLLAVHSNGLASRSPNWSASDLIPTLRVLCAPCVLTSCFVYSSRDRVQLDFIPEN